MTGAAAALTFAAVCLVIAIVAAFAIRDGLVSLTGALPL